MTFDWLQFGKISLQILGGTAAALLVLTYLAKTLLKHLFQKDLNEHKHGLELASNTAIEQLKSQLVHRIINT
jgi:hypothetical protein